MTDGQFIQKKLRVKLIILSKLAHNRLIVTGFHELSKKKKIILEIVEDYKRGQDLKIEGITEAIIDNRIKIAYDTMDGYNFNTKLMDDYLDDVDYYFKRSYSKDYNRLFFPKNSNKIYPLSFNYDVSYFFNPMDFSHSLSDVLTLVRKMLLGYNIHAYERKPLIKRNNTILFMCRLWDPESKEVKNDCKAQAERRIINQMRIDIIRALRQKYGDSFLGGVYDNEYARKICPDLILGKKMTRKRHYLSIMKKSCICIASTGLHKSIGWKFAEYVVAGKAIVSEPLCYEVNGEFKKGRNYLEYSSVEECIKSVDILLRDSNLRESIEIENLEYYNKYCRPNKQIENTLSFVRKHEMLNTQEVQ